jgi:PAS domain S-box-containing protein
MRDYLRHLLADRYEVYAVADGRQALDAAGRLRPALVLADVMMPRLDGLDMLRAMRDDPALGSTPVILLSARAGEEARLEGLQADADDYIAKPFMARELLARVATHVKMAHLRRESAEREERLRGEAELERQKRHASQEQLAETSRLYHELQGREAQYRRAARELKEAEEALQANERNLSLIINTIPTAAWTTRPDGYCDFLNQRWLDYTGMTAEQAAGWGWGEAIHPDDREGLVAVWQSALTAGVPVEAEARMHRYDGAYRWFLFRANPVRDEAGKIVKWYGTNVDIEDRKRGEEALRASELSWRQIVDNIPGLVATTGAMGEVEFLNRQTLEYFGRTSEELKEWALIGAVHPDDLPGVIEARQKSIETGQIYEVEHRCRRADGVYRWFQVRGLPVRSAEGAITAWYLLLTDINDRKRAEAQVEQAYLRLAEAQQLSKTGSFITDLVADEHNWSEETFRIFEFDPAIKVTVQMVRDAVHPEELPFFDSMIARAMTGTDVDFEFRIVTARGAVKHLRGMARVMEQIAGHPLFIGALQDVTESKIAEEALDRARAELAHVARVTMLNALTASIAHEINQPLAGIITNASTCIRMLDANPPNVDGARETARRTIRDGNRASEVITRLRALFSKRELTLEPLDLNEATQEVIALSLSDLQRNRVILRSELGEDLPPVTGDRVQLQQVLLNLLRNASDAMVGVDDRPRQLLIRTRPEGGDRVCLSVQDTGTGVDPQDLEKLFEAFHTTKSDGMGIGLAVSRSIIERHHGRLWAEPNDGPGATFSFSLPVARRHPTKV